MYLVSCIVYAKAPAGIFPVGGGANLWVGGGGAQKSVKGGPHNFFRQILKYAYRDRGGVVLMPVKSFSGELPNLLKSLRSENHKLIPRDAGVRVASLPQLRQVVRGD